MTNVNRTPETFAYFDTNVFDNILKRTNGVIEQDEVRLREAIKSQKLSILPGILAVDETVANQGRPEFIVPQLRLILELCDWDRIVKSPDILLTDDIRHFAFDGAAGHPFVEARLRDGLCDAMRTLLEDPAKLAQLRDLVRNARSQKEGFCQNVLELKRETQSEFHAAMEREGVCSFDDYFQKESGLVAGWLADHVGLGQQCRGRPLDEFLKVRSVRMAVGMALSYIWATNVENWKAKPSDSGDLQHAIPAAAAAEIFVTHDSGLADVLRRVPLRGLGVTTLKQLLNDL
jgi:hypothetical protein